MKKNGTASEEALELGDSFFKEGEGGRRGLE